MRGRCASAASEKSFRRQIFGVLFAQVTRVSLSMPPKQPKQKASDVLFSEEECAYPAAATRASKSDDAKGSAGLQKLKSMGILSNDFAGIEFSDGKEVSSFVGAVKNDNSFVGNANGSFVMSKTGKK
jgi:hypothetical protein